MSGDFQAIYTDGFGGPHYRVFKDGDQCGVIWCHGGRFPDYPWEAGEFRGNASSMTEAMRMVRLAVSNGE